MGGPAPANQLRLSFTGSEDGEAETETCRAAKPLRRTTTRTSRPGSCGLNLLNRRMRTRMYGGVAGGGRGLLRGGDAGFQRGLACNHRHRDWHTLRLLFASFGRDHYLWDFTRVRL